MDSRTFLDGLNASEIQVECLVRGLSPTDSNSQIELNNLLVTEQTNKEIRPKSSHVISLPEIEIETCKGKSLELNNLSDRLGQNPTIDESWVLFTRSKHWRDRAERISNTFGNIMDINSIASSIRRVMNWQIKRINDVRAQQKGHAPEQTNTAPQPSFAPTINSSPNASSDKVVIENFQSVSSSQVANKNVVNPLCGTLPKNPSQLQGNILNSIFPPNPHLNSILLNNQNNQSQVYRQVPPIPNYRNDYCVNQPPNQVNIPNLRSHVNYENLDLGLPQANPPIGQAVNLRGPFAGQEFKLRQKWNIAYDGSNSKNVRDFIYRLETLATDDGYPLANLTRILHMFLSDKANDWFWVYKQSYPNTTWVEMRAAIIAYFSRFDSEDETREQIIRRFQGVKESFSDFSLEIQKLNGRLGRRLSEREILHRLFHNMHPALRNATLGYQAQILSVEDLRILCSRFEQLWGETSFDPKRNYEPQFRRRLGINEVQGDVLSSENLYGLNQHGDNYASRSCCGCSCSQKPPLIYDNNPHCNAIQSNFQPVSNNLYGQSISLPQYPQESTSNPFYNPAQYNDPGTIVDSRGRECVEISEISDQNKFKAPSRSMLVICWNCHDLGHIYPDCTQPLLHQFCFGCGVHGVIKPNCNICKNKKNQGNLSTGGVNQRGQSRSNQTSNNLNSNQTGQQMLNK